MKLTLLPLEPDHIVRIQCDGPIRVNGMSSSRDPLQQLLGSHCFSHRVLLFLGNATAIDTSGVAWLIHNTERFAQSGGRFVIVGLPPTVGQYFRLLKLEELVQTAETEADAVELTRSEHSAELMHTATREGNNGHHASETISTGSHAEQR